MQYYNGSMYGCSGDSYSAGTVQGFTVADPVPEQRPDHPGHHHQGALRQAGARACPPSPARAAATWRRRWSPRRRTAVSGHQGADDLVDQLGRLEGLDLRRQRQGPPGPLTRAAITTASPTAGLPTAGRRGSRARPCRVLRACPVPRAPCRVLPVPMPAPRAAACQCCRYRVLRAGARAACPAVAVRVPVPRARPSRFACPSACPAVAVRVPVPRARPSRFACPCRVPGRRGSRARAACPAVAVRVPVPRARPSRFACPCRTPGRRGSRARAARPAAWLGRSGGAAPRGGDQVASLRWWRSGCGGRLGSRPGVRCA